MQIGLKKIQRKGEYLGLGGLTERKIVIKLTISQ